MDKKIRDAVEWGKSLGGYKMDILLDLAERYLEVGMPEKKQFNTEPEFFQKDSNCDFNYVNGYNQAIDDYRIWLAKRLDGIESDLLGRCIH